ncbi:hypothetical protein, partial [Gibbsiella quercinecans]|uniref:hypothetical protein n=1 Tax=Gibbsiella quercinecans TaxID=929813 RepID=UPI00242B203E
MRRPPQFTSKNPASIEIPPFFLLFLRHQGGKGEALASKAGITAGFGHSVKLVAVAHRPAAVGLHHSGATSGHTVVVSAVMWVNSLISKTIHVVSGARVWKPLKAPNGGT